MILFRATSHHQLINALAIKCSLYKDSSADIILSNMTDFSSILNALEDTGVFRKVYYVDDVTVAKDFLSRSIKERYRFSKKIGNLWNINLDTEYTDYFYGYNILCNKLFYYFLINQQRNVIPHAFQEGCSSYLVNMFTVVDHISHEYYGKRSLIKQISDLYFYMPEEVLFKSRVPIKEISIKDSTLCSLIKRIYNPPKLSDEKYIFIAVNSEFQNVSSNEIELLDMIAEIVGKENILVKTHPRCNHDKFSYRGYKTMNSSIAFEAYLFDPDIRNKIMISTNSTSLLAAMSYLDDDLNAIFIKDLFHCDLSRFINNEKMDKFLKRVTDKKALSVLGEKHVFYARNLDNFKEIIVYMQGEERSEKNNDFRNNTCI